LSSWLEHIPGIVINRPGVFTCDNCAKPLHEAHLTELGFRVPAALTSACAEELMAFASGCPVIVKTISGVRANTRMVEPQEFSSFDPRQGPVHLQRYIAGTDVRAHVVDRRVHAEHIAAQAVDYRQCAAGMRTNSSYTFAEPIAAKIVEATTQVGLEFAGWDFKIAPDGTLWCLEVNPMPAYDGYDRRLSGVITDSLLRRLLATAPAYVHGQASHSVTRRVS
jgi:glutathione synthase/RimK-type ligase-like ATP-grasp enzyme